MLFSGILVLVSCAKERSPVTAWEYNQPKNGGFEVVPYEEQETGPGLVLVQGGTFTMGRCEQDVTYDWNNIPRRVTVSSFYMDQTEVRNLDYLEYIHWTERVFGANFPEILKKAMPDTLVWRDRLAFNEPYVELYLRHPAYRDYPVVGINWLQASDFCAWRTDRVNEFILIREGILNHNPSPTETDYFNTDQYLAGKWQGTVVTPLHSMSPDGGDRLVRVEDGIFLPRYRLPTEAEWEFAAYGLIGNTIGERITDRRIYPWNGHGVRNPDEKYIGQMHANFIRGAGDYMGTAGWLNDNADVTAPVYSYWPNDYGLYNMAGNVAEWVMDIYRPMTSSDASEFRPFRGNVFKTQVKDSTDNTIATNTDGILIDKVDHTKKKVNPPTPHGVSQETQEFADTSIVNSVPGRVLWRDVTIAKPEDKLDERRNYKTNDYRDYLDGDVNSSLYYQEGEDAFGERTGKMMYEYAKTSLVNNWSRVYKGGSWRDRAYWMNPGSRRFLDEKQAKDYIGFRCAMTRVGSPTGLGK